MGSVRRAGILLTVLVVVVGLGGVTAGAKHKHKKKGKPWASQMTLAKSSSTQFNGVVNSKLKACRGSRVVTLFYTDPNTGQTSPLRVQRTDGGWPLRGHPVHAGLFRYLPRPGRAAQDPGDEEETDLQGSDERGRHRLGRPASPPGPRLGACPR